MLWSLANYDKASAEGLAERCLLMMFLTLWNFTGDDATLATSPVERSRSEIVDVGANIVGRLMAFLDDDPTTTNVDRALIQPRGFRYIL